MINFTKDYFNDNCYFNLKVDGDKVFLSYNVYNTLNESKHKEEKREFKTKSLDKIKKSIQKFIKSKNKVSKGEVDKEMDNIEIDEYVDSDGTMLTSKTPIYNMYLFPSKTMDQTVVSTRIPNDPLTRGYRVRYYGESIEKDENLIDEENMRDAFGFEETKDKDFNDTVKTFKKMGIEDPIERIERAEQLGKIRGQKVRKTKSGKKVLKQRLTEKEIEEEKKNRMIKMVEDILTKKNKDDNDVIDKTDSLSKIIVKNLENIKKLAEKEGISISKLINILKQGE
jgi:hypothetical protein